MDDLAALKQLIDSGIDDLTRLIPEDSTGRIMVDFYKAVADNPLVAEMLGINLDFNKWEQEVRDERGPVLYRVYHELGIYQSLFLNGKYEELTSELQQFVEAYNGKLKDEDFRRELRQRALDLFAENTGEMTVMLGMNHLNNTLTSLFKGLENKTELSDTERQLLDHAFFVDSFYQDNGVPELYFLNYRNVFDLGPETQLPDLLTR